MKKMRTLAMLLMVATGISACGSMTKEKLGLEKSSPNEFMVTPRAPLSLPPEYGLLPVGMENYYNNDLDELSAADKGLLERIAKQKNVDNIQEKADNELKNMKTYE